MKGGRIEIINCAEIAAPGWTFLRDAIARHDFQARGADIKADEIFVSDGAKCDSGNIQEIFGIDNRVALTDPVYPVYCDSNVMAGRTGPPDESGRYEGIEYLPCTAENGFVPPLPDRHVDSLHRVWRDWRFVPMLHVAEDLAIDPDGSEG